jgi:copper chaperone NosL
MRGAWMLAVAALVACASPVAGPPEVHWGVDECSRCHMILSEPRYAGVARGSAGEEERFDDLGCMVAFLNEGKPADWTAWVHDATTDTWVSASSSWYARAGATHSPMGSGIVAYASREAATKAAGASAPLSWTELLAGNGSGPAMSSFSFSHSSTEGVVSADGPPRSIRPSDEPSTL